ncbi:MAG TPA: tryptophan-rich sensory protein [Candidatus Omnitrophota bacterium]|nr:tryptophan-rich sensory protein [Candidatus Omnitrophota bacterium]
MTILKSLAGFFLFLILCFGTAWFGASQTYPAVKGWYAGLLKPPFTPPDWVFGPVWSVLYLMMAYSAWRVWRKTGFRKASGPMLFWTGQLILNGMWSWLFFGMKMPGAAFAEILLLEGMIGGTIFSFRKIDRFAGWLLVPYGLWVFFAAFLNFGIWRLNG